MAEKYTHEKLVKSTKPFTKFKTTRLRRAGRKGQPAMIRVGYDPKSNEWIPVEYMRPKDED